MNPMIALNQIKLTCSKNCDMTCAVGSGIEISDQRWSSVSVEMSALSRKIRDNQHGGFRHAKVCEMDCIMSFPFLGAIYDLLTAAD